MADGGADLISASRPGVEIASRAPGSGAGRQAERVTPPAGGVPKIRWGPDTIGRRRLFEAWHEAARPLFDTAPVRQERSFSGGGTVARLGELIVTEVDFSGQRFWTGGGRRGSGSPSCSGAGRSNGRSSAPAGAFSN